MKRVLISGITGQDGSYLAESLLADGCVVYGIIRRRSSTKLIDHILPRLTLYYGDVTDPASLERIFMAARPQEIYNLAAQSFVGAAWQLPGLTLNVTGLGALNMLEAMRQHAPDARFYQAGTSEQFGASPPPQNEETPFYPRSPYGCAKVLACHLVRNYRESYGLKAITGILNNHESPRRGPEFVTRKITMAVARIRTGQQQKLQLGNLDARRDWGHAREYVEAMRLMLAAPELRDYVVGTGVTHSVREFADAAFQVAGLKWQDYVEVDPALSRLAEVRHLCADASAIKRDLGWTPRMSFENLVREMVAHDLKELKWTNSI